MNSWCTISSRMSWLFKTNTSLENLSCSTIEIWLFVECQIICREFFRTLGKQVLCRVPNKKHSVKKHSAKVFFAECFIFDTRQKVSLPSVFSTLDKDNLKIVFWSSKLIQMKKFSTTKLYNSSRCTIYILVVSSYDK
jgi:hypothetical protein